MKNIKKNSNVTGRIPKVNHNVSVGQRGEHAILNVSIRNIRIIMFINKLHYILKSIHNRENGSSLLNADSILLEPDVFSAVVNVDASVFRSKPHSCLPGSHISRSFFNFVKKYIFYFQFRQKNLYIIPSGISTGMEAARDRWNLTGPMDSSSGLSSPSELSELDSLLRWLKFQLGFKIL